VPQQARKSGREGEDAVAEVLRLRGWFVENLNDTLSNHPNADLRIDWLGNERLVQVRATDGEKWPKLLQLGHAGKWLRGRAPFFNSVADRLKADVVVLVHAASPEFRFFVLPVSVAEYLARLCAENWQRIPKKDGTTRSSAFYSALPLLGLKRRPEFWEPPGRALLLKFEDDWDVIEAPRERLLDRHVWSIDFSPLEGG
jgi:hypothetical protein